MMTMILSHSLAIVVLSPNTFFPLHLFSVSVCGFFGRIQEVSIKSEEKVSLEH